MLDLPANPCLFPAFSGGRTWEMIRSPLLSESGFSRLCKEIPHEREASGLPLAHTVKCSGLGFCLPSPPGLSYLWHLLPGPCQSQKGAETGRGAGGLGTEPPCRAGLWAGPWSCSGCCVGTTCASGPSSGTPALDASLGCWLQPFSCAPAASLLLTSRLETLLCGEPVWDRHQCFWKVSAYFLLMRGALRSLDVEPSVMGRDLF